MEAAVLIARLEERTRERPADASRHPSARRPLLRRRSAPPLRLDARARARLLGPDGGTVGYHVARGRAARLARAGGLLLAPELASRRARAVVDDQPGRPRTPPAAEPRQQGLHAPPGGRARAAHPRD